MVLSDREGFKWKILVTGWAFMECLLFGGLLYGWVSINFVFKAEGIYSDLCPMDSSNTTVTYEGGSGANDTVKVVTLGTSATPINLANETKLTEAKEENTECKPQDSNMALCFTIGSALFCVGCAILGHVNYKFGTRMTRIIAFLFFIAGSLMLAFVSKENSWLMYPGMSCLGIGGLPLVVTNIQSPWLMYPGLSCLGIGGLPLLVTNTQVANLFVKGSSSVVGLLCGGFDTSAAVMLLMKIASENGFSRRNTFFIITALHSLVLVSTFFFLPKDFIKKRQAKSPTGEVAGETEVGVELLESKGDQVDNEKGPALPSLWSCVRNPMFLTHIVWLCLLQLRFFYFIGTLNPYLGRVLNGDKEKVSYFTNVWSSTLMGGLFTSFFAGIVYDWQKNMLKDGKSERYRKVTPAAIPQGIASLLSVLLSILVLIPVPNILYVTFIVVTLKRSFLYSLGAAFIGEVFPGEYFGMLYGIMIVCGGVFGFVQYAFFKWAEAYIGGAMHADIFLLVMMFLSFLHPIYLWVSGWKEERKFKIN